MQNKSKNIFFKNLILVLLVIIIGAIPLIFVRNAEFSGADDNAKNAIAEFNPTYKPIFQPIWEPPSSEIATLIFSLQAAIGAGIIGYFIGFARGKKIAKDDLH